MVKYDGYTIFMIFKIISIRVDLLFSVGFKMYAQVPLRAQPLPASQPELCSLSLYWSTLSLSLTNLRSACCLTGNLKKQPTIAPAISVWTDHSFIPRLSWPKHHHGSTDDRYSGIWLCPSGRSSYMDTSVLAGRKYLISTIDIAVHSTFKYTYKIT